MSKNVPNKCEFCQASFTCAKSLLRHLRTANKCLSQRPKKDFTCIWCQEVFYSNNFLNEHLTKCTVNKEALLTSYIEKLKEKDDIIKEKERDIKYKDDIIKQKDDTIKQKDDIIKQKDANIDKLQEKLFTIANKPTTTTNNIKTINNIKLNCDKPLNLEFDNVFNMMKNHLNTTYLSQGGYGICKWFLKYVCTNERGNICIECTDKSRKIFKYKDDEDELKRVTGDDLHKLVKKSYAKFTTTPLYLEFDEWEREQRERGRDTMDILSGLMNYKKDFLTHLADKTCVSSGVCELNTE
jgi:FtsZ-binding cell division protein ZapB